MKSKTQYNIPNIIPVRSKDASKRFPHIKKSVMSVHVVALLSAAALTACGGGEGGTGTSATEGAQTLASISTGVVKTPTTPTVLSPVSPAAPVTPVPPVVVVPTVAGSFLTDVRIQNTGTAQTNVPFTFGQVFAVGALKPTEGLAAKFADGTVLRLQMDTKATHADGSVRHAIVSGVLPTLAANQTQKFDLTKSTLSELSTVTPKGLLSAGLTGNIAITVDNVKYTASLADAVNTSAPTTWLSGSVANEWFFEAPLKTASGTLHPLLTARFGVRWYAGLTKQARIEVVVENNKTFAAPARNYTYDVNVDIGGKSVYSKTGLTHYHHARWHQYAWWDAAHQPAVNVQLNTAYLIASKAVSNYDQSIVVPESVLSGMGQSLNATNTGPMSIGTVVAYMGMTGGRGDIGPLPDYTVNYLLSMDKRAKDVMLANADGSGSWSIHYRDENTNLPVRTDNEANKRMSTHPNLAWSGPLPVPRCAVGSSCDSPYADDLAHLPSLTYLPYLVTGDYFYLEETQFWAASDPLGTDPGYSGLGQGLLRWQQVRGQAWGLRTLGHAAYITPDASPLKGYFTKQVDNNLNFYNQTYVVGNPNKLGMYDGSGEGSMGTGASLPPWQDDFFTWSFGYLNELGFTKAKPIFDWKAKYSVGRMTSDGYCWIAASAYSLKFRDSDNGPVYDSFAKLYQSNYGSTMVPGGGGDVIAALVGSNFMSLACGSKSQADYLAKANNSEWLPGQMIGYSSSVIGFPSNMQPALAIAASSGVTDGAKAWNVFVNRSVKPDYSQGPQWNIIPR